MIASQTEEQIYRALDLPFIPPQLREDAGEIEAAERGALPPVIPALTGDFHLHTTVSGDGRSTLEEMVAGAIARGYTVLAVTDHAEGTSRACRARRCWRSASASARCRPRWATSCACSTASS